MADGSGEEREGAPSSDGAAAAHLVELVSVEAVIDEDFASALLANDLNALETAQITQGG